MGQRRGLAVLVAAGVVAGGLAQVPARATPTHRVIIQASSVGAAAEAVRRAGGRVERELGIVDGVAAVVPAGAVLTGVDAVSPNRPVRTASVDSGGPGTAVNAFRQETRATTLVSPTRSVAVALIDTGIAPVGGLADNLVPVPDPLHEGQTAVCANFSTEPTCDDSYGHGTFLAGLVAGDGPYPGMDPSARLVSVKIAGRDGAADTGQLLAAVQYVVSFKDELGIGVLNLSLGTASDHDSRKDPLNRAVERAWEAGITVVVAAGNSGHLGDAGTISKPGDDPLVVTVGAVDDRGTATRGDDLVPGFTAQGPVLEGTDGDTFRVDKPDVAAPGVGLVSLTSPGSHIEETAPPSTVGVAGYRRGSGTSQAAAVVSGAVALLLERRAWTPDQVKAALVRGAYRLGAPVTEVGAGIVSVSAALDQSVSGAVQPLPRQDPLEGMDGGDAYANGTWDGQSWYGQSWYGQSWYGQSWYGQSWYGQSWYGQSWYEDSTDYGTVSGPASYGAWR